MPWEARREYPEQQRDHYDPAYRDGVGEVQCRSTCESWGLLAIDELYAPVGEPRFLARRDLLSKAVPIAPRGTFLRGCNCRNVQDRQLFYMEQYEILYRAHSAGDRLCRKLCPFMVTPNLVL